MLQAVQAYNNSPAKTVDDVPQAPMTLSHLSTCQAPSVVQHAAREHPHQCALAAVHVANDGHTHLHGAHTLTRTATHQHVSSVRHNHTTTCGGGQRDTHNTSARAGTDLVSAPNEHMCVVTCLPKLPPSLLPPPRPNTHHSTPYTLVSTLPLYPQTQTHPLRAPQWSPPAAE